MNIEQTMAKPKLNLVENDGNEAKREELRAELNDMLKDFTLKCSRKFCFLGYEWIDIIVSFFFDLKIEFKTKELIREYHIKKSRSLISEDAMKQINSRSVVEAVLQRYADERKAAAAAKALQVEAEKIEADRVSASPPSKLDEDPVVYTSPDPHKAPAKKQPAVKKSPWIVCPFCGENRWSRGIGQHINVAHGVSGVSAQDARDYNDGEKSFEELSGEVSNERESRKTGRSLK